MKITTPGLQHILSLGLKRETSVPGVYFLYSWDGMNYLGGSKGLAHPKEYKKIIFITLSPEQLRLLQNTFEAKSSSYESLTAVFSTVILLDYVEPQNSLVSKDCAGENTLLKNFNCKLDFPSPFKIVKDTIKPFHGFYNPVENLNTSFENCHQNLKNLWITALPVLKDNKLTGVLAGFSNSATYGTDIFKKFEPFLKA